MPSRSSSFRMSRSSRVSTRWASVSWTVTGSDGRRVRVGDGGPLHQSGVALGEPPGAVVAEVPVVEGDGLQEDLGGAGGEGDGVQL